MLISLVFITSLGNTAEASDVRVLVDGKKLSLDVKPVIENGRTLVPFRVISEELGAKVDWDERTETVTAIKGKTTIKLVLNNRTAFVNNTRNTLDVPAVSRNGRTLVPLRFVAEALGANVHYNGTNRTVTVETKVPLRYVTGFSIEYVGNGSKKVTDGEGRTLLLVPRGQKAPAGYDGIPVIYTPIENVIAGSTTQVSLLRPLNVLDSIKGVTTNIDDWYIDEIKRGLSNKSITYVGDSRTPDYEKIQTLRPELIFAYTGPYGQQQLIQKVSELGFNYAVNNEYLEEHPFGRMEWIKFLGAFYNKEAEATAYFNNAVKSAENLSNKLPKGQKPKVLWGLIWKGEVYVPYGGSYVAKMIEMAGGDYVFKEMGPNNTGSAKITIEEFYAKGIDADILIYSSTSNRISSVQTIIDNAPILASIKPIKNEQVWVFQPWYHQSIDKTHEIIEDLAALFYPSTFRNHQVKHYDKLLNR
jgi:iron complex transport system substrate-binding protein